MRRPHSSDPVLRLQNPTYTACVSGGLRGHNSSTPAAALIQRSGSKRRCSLSEGIPEPQSVVIHWDLEPRNPANSTGERFVHSWVERYLRLDRLLSAHSLCRRPTSCIVTVPPVMNYWRRVLSVADTEVVLKPPQCHLTASTLRPLSTPLKHCLSVANVDF